MSTEGEGYKWTQFSFNKLRYDTLMACATPAGDWKKLEETGTYIRDYVSDNGAEFSMEYDSPKEDYFGFIAFRCNYSKLPVMPILRTNTPAVRAYTNINKLGLKK